MRILHALSQRPEATGSGIYVRAMVREAFRAGHENFLLAGIPSGDQPQLDCLTGDHCSFVHFETGSLPFPVVGMSDVMPYPSRRFSDLTAADLEVYENCFANRLERVVQDFQPDLVHSHHLWLLTSLIKRSFPKIPVVTTCHGSDLRQFQKCRDLQPRVQSGCAGLEGIMALSRAQKREILRVYGFAPDQVTVVGVGYHQEIFKPGPKPLPPPIEMVYAGKLSRAKGVPWMLRALSEVSEPSWRLHLIGGGDWTGKRRGPFLGGKPGRSGSGPRPPAPGKIGGDFPALPSPDFTFLLRRTGPGPAGSPGLRLPLGLDQLPRPRGSFGESARDLLPAGGTAPPEKFRHPFPGG